jgi:hypothetical protein
MNIEKKWSKTTEKVENRWYLDSTYPKSSHRDGAIYRNWLIKKEWEEADITNRNESKWQKSLLVFFSLFIHILEWLIWMARL